MLPSRLLVFLSVALAVCLFRPLASVGQTPDLGDIDPFSQEEAKPEQPAPEGGTLEGQPPAEDQAAKDVSQMQPEELMEAGDRLAAEGKWGEAIGYYNRVLQITGNRYAPALLKRGVCLLELGDLELALESFSAAIESGTAFPDLYKEALYQRGSLLLDLYRYQEAAEDFALAIRVDPANPELRFLHGRALIRASQQATSMTSAPADILENAIASLDRAIAMKEDYAEAYAERGSARLAIGQMTRSRADFDQAIEDVDRAASLDSQNPDTQAKQGFAHIRRADNERSLVSPDMDQVVADYREAAAVLSRYLSAHGGKTAEDYEEADPEVIKPDQVYLGRAIAKVGLGKLLSGDEQSDLYREAIDDCNASLRFSPDSPNPLFQRGLAYRLLGELNNALDAYSEGLELFPEHSDARLRRGIIWYYLGDLDMARADFEQVRHEMQDARSLFWIGVTFAKEGDLREAVFLYTAALRQDPNYMPAYNNRGLAYMRLGHYDRAMDDFGEILRRDPHDEVARERRDQARKLLQQ